LDFVDEKFEAIMADLDILFYKIEKNKK